MTACHFTPSQIDDMTMLEANALFKYWQDFPPAHEAIKLAYRIERKKSEETPRKDANDPSGLAGLIAMFPDGNVPATR